MGKIETLNTLINKCESKKLEGLDKQAFLRAIITTYSNEISNLQDGFTLKESPSDRVIYSYNLDYDVELLKFKLEKYRDNLIREDQKRNDELLILKLKNQITINTHNTNNPILSATAIATVSVSQTMKSINELPDDILNKEETTELNELIHTIDKMIAAKDKEGIKSKVEKCLKFIADKGIDVLIATGPYLLQAAGVIQTIS